MLVLAASVVALLSPLAALRWPAGVLLYRWRWPLLVWAAVVLQTVSLVVAFPGAGAPIAHVLSYALAVGFLWVNRRAPGVWFVGAGAFVNGVVIALNGGTLPTSAAAAAAAGIEHGPGFTNAAVLDDPILPWLGDVFAWPAPLPLANTFSVGDVLIVIGVFVAAWTGARRLGAAPSNLGRA